MLKVTYFHRKKRICSYSVEFVFEQLRRDLADRVLPKVKIAPFHSNGVLRRLAIILHTALNSGAINHITGDITFAGILLPPQNTVLTILDCGGADAPGIKGFLLRWIWFRLPSMRASIITTISNAARDDILRITNCSPDKVVVVPIAVSDIYKFESKPHLSIPPRILQVGTSANKNVERVIKAVSGIPCTLVIVGELSAIQRKLLNDHSVNFENYVGLSLERMFEEYRNCDLVTFVSLFEGFGMPIIEAQSVGRPVITSRLCSIPEVAGDAAYYVDDPTRVDSIRDAVLHLLQDNSVRNKLVQDGVRNAQRFSSESIAEQYMAIYERI